MQILLISIVIIVVILLAIYTWLEGFKKIQFSAQVAGGEVLVYESHIGDYKNQMSINMGIMKVYPALNRYIR